MVDLQNIKPPLTNAQFELLKVFSMRLSEEDEAELQNVLSRFLSDKIRNRADKVWREKGYDMATVEKWLNEKNGTEANAAMKRARAAADKAFIERGYTAETIEGWLNEK